MAVCCLSRTMSVVRCFSFLGHGLFLRLLFLSFVDDATLFVAGQFIQGNIQDVQTILQGFNTVNSLRSITGRTQCVINSDQEDRMRSVKGQELSFYQQRVGLSSEEEALACCIQLNLDCANKQVARVASVDARSNFNVNAPESRSFSFPTGRNLAESITDNAIASIGSPFNNAAFSFSPPSSSNFNRNTFDPSRTSSAASFTSSFQTPSRNALNAPTFTQENTRGLGFGSFPIPSDTNSAFFRSVRRAPSERERALAGLARAFDPQNTKNQLTSKAKDQAKKGCCDHLKLSEKLRNQRKQTRSIILNE